MFKILQLFITCKGGFIQSVSDVLLAGRYLFIFYICLSVICICLVWNGKFMHPSIPASQNNIHVVLFTIWLYLMHAWAGLMSWINSVFHYYDNLEVLYMFRKVPTILWSLVDVRNVLYYLYTSRFQPSLYGNNSSV